VVVDEQINVCFTHHEWLEMVLLIVCVGKGTKGQKTTTVKLWPSNKLLAIDPPPKLVGSIEYGWSFMPTTSQNMGLLHGIPSVPCEGGHLVLIVQIGPRLTTLSNLSLGASNGAEIISPISVQTSNICKVHRVSKKIVKLEMQHQKINGKKP
jgi:hypothetical protein